MFGWRRRPGRDLVEGLHERLVAASREPALYGPGGLPDTIEGRFESLALHAQLVLRRLRDLPPPASDFAQELVDLVFAHLEVALREMGVGDFGVPKRMKKLAGAFYDRLRLYDAPLAAGDAAALASLFAEHVPGLDAPPLRLAGYAVAADRALARLSFADLTTGSPFAGLAPSIETSR